MLYVHGKKKREGMRRAVSFMMACMLLLGSLTIPEMKMKAAGDNLIANPNFAEEDMSAWMDVGATLTRESQDTAIFDDVTTFATISGRTQSYQGFSQDVTDKVVPGAEYEISFYVKLSEEYQELSASQRQVFFGPYVVENGQTSYLSQSYSPQIRGDLVKEVPVGQWVKLSGTYVVSEEATQVVVRFQEESSRGYFSYSITGVSMVLKETVQKPEPKNPEEAEELPILRDAITAELGEGTIVGMVTHPVNNKKEWELLTTHANAITAGNEFKPDAHFGYSNGRCPGTETVTLNGNKLLVPKIDYSRGEQVLNAVLKYNEENPDNPIKVRGHVLVWHAQTPEWFFHEDYDPTKDYVSKEVMDQRLEWYIKSLFEHYMGKDSKYKGLFYGWDVVNEACADSTAQVYRDDKGGNDKLTDSTHSSKSSWWHIYQSNEYIINAFKYANKYAPADVELYYNDYNDSWPVKVPNICALLKAVKEQEGAPGVGTRIDAYGMQAHYGLDSFDVGNFEDAARQYLDIVGKIQLTELDMGASSNYDGTEATKDQEYMEQALVYQSIYEVLKKLDATPGYEVGGITFWGVTDPYSWLQNKSDLGGGADGLRSQCPLLFDGNYEAKPAFWAFVNPSKIKIVKKKVEIRRSYDGKYKDGESYTFESGSTSATMIPIWDQEGLKLQVEVKDKSLDGEADFVTLYIDEDVDASDGITPQKCVIKRTEGSSIGGGYRVTFKVPLKDVRFGKQFLFDVKINNADGTIVSFNDIHQNQENSSLNYAICTLKPALTRVSQGSPKVDGEMDEVWNTTESFWLNVNTGAAQCAARVKVLWDQKKLYVYAEVEDSDVSVAGKEAYEKDSLEIYIDEDHGRSVTYANDDKRYRISAENEVSCLGKKAAEKKVESKAKKTDFGYVIEASFEWTDLSPKVHNLVGFDLRINDANSDGVRIGTLSWCDGNQDAGTDTSCFGVIKLAAAGEEIADKGNPDADISQMRAFTQGSLQSSAKEEDVTGEAPAQVPMSDEKEVPDNPKKNDAMPWILGGCGVAVVALLGALVAVRAKGKKEQDQKTSKKKK
ncbi:MAG: endo-1,4-beta-xylanase [Lachnospiraceae bacterium]|nr:endo-1,4-beta-xylanase [Lachnospiraceae bacterium]